MSSPTAGKGDLLSKNRCLQQNLYCRPLTHLIALFAIIIIMTREHTIRPMARERNPVVCITSKLCKGMEDGGGKIYAPSSIKRAFTLELLFLPVFGNGVKT